MAYFCLLYPGQRCGSVSFPTLPVLPGNVLGRPWPWTMNQSAHSSLAMLTIQNEGRKTRTPKPLKAPTLQLPKGKWIWVSGSFPYFWDPVFLDVCSHAHILSPFDQTCLLAMTMTCFLLILYQRKQTQPKTPTWKQNDP